VGRRGVFVDCDAEQGRVCGYDALAAAAVTHEQATERARKGQPRHPIPAVLLARLAVDASVQGHGIGAWLMQDASAVR
jgi:predicted N-acetyltransferase YhbS